MKYNERPPMALFDFKEAHLRRSGILLLPELKQHVIFLTNYAVGNLFSHEL